MAIIPPPEFWKDLWGHVRTRHLKIIDSCPAVMNNQNGFLGISKGVWYRVWFDSESGDTTLCSTTDKEEALKKYEDFKNKYGT